MDNNLINNWCLRLLTTEDKPVIEAIVGKNILVRAKNAFRRFLIRVKLFEFTEWSTGLNYSDTTDSYLEGWTSEIGGHNNMNAIDLRAWILGEIDHATEEVSTNIYALIRDASFFEITSSLSTDLNKLCLTGAQIKSFCLTHRYELQIGFSATLITFFFFKRKDRFFVAKVFYHNGKLYVSEYMIENDSKWCIKNDSRRDREDDYQVVVPCL